MNKSLLTIILAGLFSTSALALSPATETSNINMDELMSEIQSASETGALNNQKEEKKSKIGRTLLKRAIQYKVIKTVVKNPRKTLIAGAAIGGLGYYGYYKMKKELFKKKIAKHELFDQEWQNMIDYYPDEWEALLKRVEHDLKHSDDEEHVENLEKFLDFVAVSAKSKKLAEEVMEGLGSNGTHSFIISDVEKIFKEAEEDFNKTGKKCTVDDLKKLLDPNEDFIGYTEKINQSNGEFSVSSYKNLSALGGAWQKDHIPSYKAIESFLIINGINVPLKTRDGKEVIVTKNMLDRMISSAKDNVEKKIKTERNTFLENFTTAINVDNELHGKGRTYKGRNYSKQYVNDAYNLRDATKLDIAFELSYLKKNNLINKYQEYLKSSKILIRRNFELCLYQ